MKKIRKEKLSFGKITLLEINHLKAFKGGENFDSPTGDLLGSTINCKNDK